VFCDRGDGQSCPRTCASEKTNFLPLMMSNRKPGIQPNPPKLRPRHGYVSGCFSLSNQICFPGWSIAMIGNAGVRDAI